MTREANRSPDSEHRHQQTAARAPLAPSAALDIQRTAGNAALIQLLRQAGHPWAQEQHQHAAGCGHQQNARAGQPAVQRSAVHDVLRTSGRPLDDATRTDMESRLGADFSDVRVHDDSAARASAAEVGARAYTSGNHVVIGDGGTDKHTLAHELTHVIQQRQGPVAGTDNGSGLKISDPSDRYEREAEANATRVMRSALPEVSPAAERDQQAATEGAVVQRVIGQNSSTAGVDHAQGEHVFNDVATLVNEFREATRAQGGALIIWVNGDGKVHSKAKRRRVVAKLTAANTQPGGDGPPGVPGPVTGNGRPQRPGGPQWRVSSARSARYVISSRTRLASTSTVPWTGHCRGRSRWLTRALSVASS
ncbi:DUF4157 domain-containing protein [Streptomyces sp. NPDC007355]|uniref:eCIS core domain-containing protein n=1 Tax=Streptomyces sp. NPDC007355 TaxID=3364778 RepID=UPI0036AF7AF0